MNFRISFLALAMTAATMGVRAQCPEYSATATAGGAVYDVSLRLIDDATKQIEFTAGVAAPTNRVEKIVAQQEVTAIDFGPETIGVEGVFLMQQKAGVDQLSFCVSKKEIVRLTDKKLNSGKVVQVPETRVWNFSASAMPVQLGKNYSFESEGKTFLLSIQNRGAGKAS